MASGVDTISSEAPVRSTRSGRWSLHELSARDRLHYGALALIVVAGAFLRFAYLGEPMRFDESYSFLNYALAPVRDVTLSYNLPNNHVFNTVLMHFSFYKLGNHIWALRLPALLAGLAAPLAGYWAGRELYHRDAALWAAALIAVSSPLVDFSVNARGYELGVLFVLLALALGALVVRTTSPWPVRGFVVCAVLGAWSVPTTGYGLVIVAIWMAGAAVLRRGLAWRRIARVAGALALGAMLAYLLYWPLMGQSGWTYVGPLPRTRLAVQGLADAIWHVWWRTTSHPLDWFVAAGAVASLVLHRRLARESMPLALAWVLGIGLIVFFGKIGPFPRSWVAVLPLFLVFAGAGLAGVAQQLAARRLHDARPVSVAAALLLTVVLGAGILHAGQAGSEEPPQSDNDLVSILHQTLRPKELVLIDQVRFGAQLNYYLARAHYGAGMGIVTADQEADGHVLTIVPRDQAGLAVGQVGGLGGHPTGQPPRLVRRLRYISIYDVPVRPSARG